MSESTRDLLEQVRAGCANRGCRACEASAGCRRTRALPPSILHRRERCGFPEVIYAEGKTNEWLEGVVRRIAEAKQDCLATRVSDDQAAHLTSAFPAAEQDRLARTFWLPHGPRSPAQGHVTVVTAGTSDLPVAQEALVTARSLGCNVTRIADVGVAGSAPCLAPRDELAAADVVIVIAGMDGVLPSVVGGLVDKPVIAVPTSVGYGAAFHGSRRF